MYLKIKIDFMIILGIITFSNMASPQALNIHEVCQRIKARASELVPSIKSSKPNVFETLGFLLNPASGIGTLKLEGDKLIKLESNESKQELLASDIPLVLFSPLDSVSKLEAEKFNSVQRSISDFYKKYLAPLERQASSSLNSAQETDCEARALQEGLTPELWNQFRHDISALLNLKERNFNANLQKTIDELAKTRDTVKVVYAVDFRIIKNIIQTAETQDFGGAQFDLAFIFHGGPDGALHDLMGQVVPPIFFENLKHRSLRRLLIFSCYPEKVFQYYKAEFQALVRQNVEVFFGVSQGVFKKSPLVDVELLPYFLDKTENFTTDSQRTETLEVAGPSRTRSIFQDSAIAAYKEVAQTRDQFPEISDSELSKYKGKSHEP